MRNLNKSNILTTIEFINRTLKKSSENNFKNMGTKCTQSRKNGKFLFSVIQGLMWHRVGARDRLLRRG